MRTLPDHVVCLLHYIELTRAGWQEDALDRFVVVQLWLEKSPAPLQRIKKGI